MKRFFCKVCAKVKRVQKYPTRVVNTHLSDVTLRIGVCNHHSQMYTVIHTPEEIQKFAKMGVN